MDSKSQWERESDEITVVDTVLRFECVCVWRREGETVGKRGGGWGGLDGEEGGGGAGGRVRVPLTTEKQRSREAETQRRREAEGRESAS